MAPMQTKMYLDGKISLPSNTSKNFSKMSSKRVQILNKLVETWEKFEYEEWGLDGYFFVLSNEQQSVVER